MESSMIDALEKALPLMKDITGQDIQLSLFDKERAIATWPADNFGMPAAVPGKGLDRSDPSMQAIFRVMDTGVKDETMLPKEVLGTSIHGIITPVKENGVVVGAVTCAYSMEREEKLRDSIGELDTNLKDSADRIDKINAEAAALVEELNEIRGVTEQVRTVVNKASNMVKSIQGNASKSNILALNASIEAARSGEAGKGFAVVAAEMGKLAQVSGNSAKEISDSLKEIIDAVEGVIKAVDKVNDVAASQAEGTSEVTKNMEMITKSADDIAVLAKPI
ncbi:MAG: hypothetical protein K6C99_06530 [Lachnospiraceae bacterium]|nr:hypothetical protein [Lachnospiraceae bacterium]